MARNLIETMAKSEKTSKNLHYRFKLQLILLWKIE